MHLNSYSDTMFLAIQWALQDREAMHDAVSLKSEKEEVAREIRALNRLRAKLFGDQKTQLEGKLAETRSVSISELLEMARSGEIEPRCGLVEEEGPPESSEHNGSKPAGGD